MQRYYEIKPDDLQAALDVADADSYIYVDHTYHNPLKNETAPDELLLRKERHESLSDEVLTVINLIFESPWEFKACVIRPEFKLGGVIGDVKKTLRNLGWKWITINETIKEFREFLQSR